MSQCPEYMAPYGSYEPIFGTNPIAIGLPTKDSPIVLDMATSTCTLYHLVTCREENKELEYNLAYDEQGAITTDPIKGNSFDKSISSVIMNDIIVHVSDSFERSVDGV